VSGVDSVSAVRTPASTTVEPHGGLPQADPFARRDTTGSSPETERRLLEAAGPENLMEALEVFARDRQLESGLSAIQTKKQSMENARKAAEAALRKAAQAGKKRGFWGNVATKLATVAKVAAAAGAIASVVATGGASTLAVVALAGTLVSAYSKEICEATGAGKDWQTGLAIGGALVSVGAGIGSAIAAGSQAAQAAQATAKATEAATKTTTLGSKIAEVAAPVAKGAQVTAVVGTATSAGAALVSAHYAKEESFAFADEKELRAKRKAMQSEMEQMMELMKEFQKSHASCLETLSAARTEQAQASLTLHAGIRA
jgi:hypothetical protein